MIKLSVIIPVYNTSQYIERCLESVEKQTQQEMEVILVDDHGTDDSITKARDFAKQSKRKDIVYRFTETPQNSGPAVARNLGLQEAHGEYVAFLDADDWIEPEMYETLYAQAKVEDADLSCCNALYEYEDGRVERVLTNYKIDKPQLTISARKRVLMNYVAYFTTFIYRREMIESHHIRFADSRSAEDSAFLACCFLTATTIIQTPKALYHYIIHTGSLTQRFEWKGADKRKAFSAMIDFAKREQLMPTYKWQLWYIYIKKALFVPIVDMLQTK